MREVKSESRILSVRILSVRLIEIARLSGDEPNERSDPPG
jgi:hypothetical protein